jgi:rRNA maturation endonuclease Nob1
MLSEAFEKAESIHSTCVLEGKPIYNDAPALEAKWTYFHGDRNGDGDIIGIGECSNCHQPYECEHYCPNCGVKLTWRK